MGAFPIPSIFPRLTSVCFYYNPKSRISIHNFQGIGVFSGILTFIGVTAYFLWLGNFFHYKKNITKSLFHNQGL